MVIYPIRDDIDSHGMQLINWVAEIESAQPAQRDWSRKGRLEDFFPAFADWHFDWLDVAKLIQDRSEEHTSELQSLMRTSYAVFCLKKKTIKSKTHMNIYYSTY